MFSAAGIRAGDGDVYVAGAMESGPSFASASAVVSRRGLSPTATTVSRPLASRTVTVASSASNRPLSMAATAFRWDASANASWSSRETWSLIKRRGGRYGMATLCLGGGGSVAMAFERV